MSNNNILIYSALKFLNSLKFLTKKNKNNCKKSLYFFNKYEFFCFRQKKLTSL